MYEVCFVTKLITVQDCTSLQMVAFTKVIGIEAPALDTEHLRSSEGWTYEGGFNTNKLQLQRH